MEDKDTYSENEEEQLKESINFILNMEDPNYKTPEPCIGLTCPLTGEQYYVDWKKNAVAYPKKEKIMQLRTRKKNILYFHTLYFNTLLNTLYSF